MADRHELMKILERARAHEQEVSAQIEHVEQLHRIAEKRSENYTRESAAKLVEKIARFEQQLNEEIDRCIDAKQEALEYICKLEGEERGVIERYFMLGESWEQIASSMFMCTRRVFLLRKNALNKLKRIYDERAAVNCSAG